MQFKLYPDVQLKLYPDVQFKLYQVVKFKLYPTVRFKLYPAVQFKLYPTVQFKLYLAVKFKLYPTHSCMVLSNSRSWPSSRNINGIKDNNQKYIEIYFTDKWDLLELVYKFPSQDIVLGTNLSHQAKFFSCSSKKLWPWQLKSDLLYAMVDPTCFARQRLSFDSS